MTESKTELSMTAVLDALEAPPPVRNVARYFEYGHLDGDAREVSQAFHHHAVWLLTRLAAGAELVVALRKLCEAKDSAVRAVIFDGPRVTR